MQIRSPVTLTTGQGFGHESRRRDEGDEGHQRRPHPQVGPIERVDRGERQAEQHAPHPRRREQPPPQPPNADRREQIDAAVPGGGGIPQRVRFADSSAVSLFGSGDQSWRMR